MALFSRIRKADTVRMPTRPECPDGVRVYAVGDIHGRADLLREIHAAILEDASEFGGRKQAVYLGDFIDRGMESRQVVELLLNEPLADFESIHLMGNHEYALLNFLDDPDSIAGWLGWGGRETLYSYGIKCGLNPSSPELHNLAGELKMAMPREHIDFIENTQLCHQAGSYYFVHAGVRPGVSLADQRFEDQLWIREPFISSTRDHGAIVVHGHTIAEAVQITPHRIGLDTGAYYTGVLSALVVEGKGQRLIQTGGEP